MDQEMADTSVLRNGVTFLPGVPPIDPYQRREEQQPVEHRHGELDQPRAQVVFLVAKKKRVSRERLIERGIVAMLARATDA
ncbi:MAG: hypothetical protein L0Y71_15100 [Gemmataceae bacterium]|nr:hypothetical protein [Gemmataceae bacterium]